MKTKISMDLVLGVSEGVLSQADNEGTITLFKMDDELFFFEISGLATQAWNIIDGQSSLREICNNLANHCGASPRALQNEIIKFSENLLSEGLVFAVNKMSPAEKHPAP